MTPRRTPRGRDGARALTRRRVPWLLVALAVAFMAIGFRLVEVQALSSGRFDELGREQRVRRVTLAAERGTVFDRDGNELALSVPQHTVWADPRVVDDPMGYARQLAPLLADDPGAVATLEEELAERLAKPDAAFVYLRRKVDDTVAARIETLQLPGIHFVPESARHYPSDLAASVLGKVGIDNDGLSGLELQYDDVLAGMPGELVVERDPQGREIPQGVRRYVSPVPGSDLVLTIDHGLQFEAERALIDAVNEYSARGGRAIVLDLATGDVLAMASVSAADGPGATAPDARTARNRAVTDVYEPGSTNKVITLAGAIEEGLVAPSTVFSVPDKLQVADHVFSDHEPHPVEEWSVREILVHSSNVGAITIGKMMGKERLDQYLRAFGFGSRTGLGFPGESPGLLLDPGEWYPTSIGTVPIGSGLAVTPIQMLDVFATIANDGVLREPRLVRATVDADGVRRDQSPGKTRRVVSEQTAELMQAMLADVVTEGTGTQGSIPGYTVAGKTGTARKPLENGRGYSNKHVASFAGFAPVDNPRLAGIVVLDEPYPIFGGVVSAPTFARIMRHALRIEGVPPRHPDTGGSDVPTDGDPPPVPAGTSEEVAITGTLRQPRRG